MSSCFDCQSPPIFECCRKKLCGQCVGTHLMQITSTKHKPLPIDSSTTNEVFFAIHSKINNEILALEEFKNFSVQVISGFAQSIEKEILEICKDFYNVITEKCEKAELELRSALSHLAINDSENLVLKLFNSCKSSEDVKSVKLISKKLSCLPIHINEQIQNAIQFSLRMKTLNKKVHKKRVVSDTQAKKVHLQSFPSPGASNVYNFIPLTNKIVFYNTTDNVLSELLIDSHVFPMKSAWSVTEDYKLILTGGFDEIAKKDAFLYNIYEKKTEKIPKMMSARYNHALISVGNFIYAIGGVSFGALRDCERYNLHKKEWSFFAGLIVARECPATCHYSGKLFVAGGIGIESIECAVIGKAKFELLTLRLPGPGRCCMFPYDDSLYILLKGKILLLNLLNLSLNVIGLTEEIDIWPNSEPIVTVNHATWVCNKAFLQYQVLVQNIRLIE